MASWSRKQGWRVIGWIACEACFWLGHAISKPMHRWGIGWLYPTYNRLMGWSVAANDWAGLNRWRDTASK